MKLKTARRLARLTQKQLATLAGVDHSTISMIEAGKRRNINYDTVIRICRALEIDDPEELFPVAGTSVADEPKVRKPRRASETPVTS